MIDHTNKKKTNQKLVENTTPFNLSPTLSRTKSLIKPPPPRTSWELLLDDYLKDPNFKSILTPKVSPKNSQSNQPVPPNPFQQTFIPPSPYQYPLGPACIPCQIGSSLPPRRYQMSLDELVFLISQVGRSDLYREMVQYINTQPSSHPSNPSSNMNAYSTGSSTESFFLHDETKKNCNCSPRI